MTDSALMSSGGAETEVAPARTLPYQPALDGVRALAVLAVLFFHAEVAGFSGGYLGVSVFFTLSGYLITTLLVTEADRSGRIEVTAFYARRARRLLPASIACILGIVVIAGLTDWFDAVSTLRRDVVGSLLQVANWVFLLGGGSYQELFDQAAGTTSPLEHYWSLAIEEQFYWLWPIAFVGLVRMAPTRVARVRVLLVVTAAAGVAAPVIAAVWGADAAYWATPARAAEILVGALLAVVIQGRAVPRAAGALAPVALVLLAIAVVTFPAIGGPAYAGALPLVALVSGALLLGLQVAGPVRTALSIGPLVWLGTISYGVYLYHWPVFVLLDEQRTGIDGPPLVALRFAVTLAIAVVSFALLERPIRRNRSLTLTPTLVGAGAATVAMIALAVVVIPAGADEYWTADSEAVDAAAIDPTDEPLTALVAPAPATTIAVGAGDVAGATGAVAGEERPRGAAGAGAPEPEPAPVETPPASDPAVRPGPPALPSLERPVRVLVAGDSTARATGVGVVNWAAENPSQAQVELYTIAGCGFVKGGSLLLPEGVVRVSPGCTEYVDELIPAKAAEIQADVVALLTTSWDVQDRAWDDGVEGPTTDPEVAARVRTDLIGLTEGILAATDSSVAWIREPVSDARWEEEVLAQEEVARHEVVYAVMDEMAERYPTRVHVLDLPAFLDEAGLTADREARPDGVHWTPESATRIAGDYLGEQLIRAALDLEPR